MKVPSTFISLCDKTCLASTLFLSMLIISACQPAAASTPPPSTNAPIASATSLPPPTATEEPTPVLNTKPTLLPTFAPTDTPAYTPTPDFDEHSISIATDPKLGQYLVGDNGMTLYIFTQDEPGKSNCDLDCQIIWPPLLTRGQPDLGAGVDPFLVDWIKLEDGAMVVTYNRMPLYYYSDDQLPSDTTGKGIGMVWFMISPTGSVIFLQPSSPTKKPYSKDKGDDY